MLEECEGNYVRLIETLIKSADIEEENLKETEICLADILLNIEKLTTATNTANILNTLIFKPAKEIAPLLAEITEAEENFKTYADIRTRLALRLKFLRPVKDCCSEISVRSYIDDGHNNGKICFISCFNGGGTMKTAKLILNCGRMREVLKIFASKTISGEFRNCIVDAATMNIILPVGSSIVTSVRAAVDQESLRKIFSQTLWDNVDADSRLIKVQGYKKIWSC
jgi:hypothetical protein